MDLVLPAACASWGWCITPMRRANMPMTAKSDVGKLDKALDEATAKGWTVVDMKNDWKTIFPPAKAAP